jgi:hypothetical protein
MYQEGGCLKRFFALLKRFVAYFFRNLAQSLVIDFKISLIIEKKRFSREADTFLFFCSKPSHKRLSAMRRGFYSSI